tara:strand:- start:20130 stop:20537 length:408 start_codon:yes stop_codon:yes gene_type:complete
MSYILLNDSGQRSLTNLIGWLSLCLVSAAWGAELDSTTRHLWANIGLFGLAAMIALKVVQLIKLTNQQRATESRVDHKLERIAKGNETMAQLNAELRRLENEEHLYHETMMEAHSSDELLSLVHPWGQVNPQFDP